MKSQALSSNKKNPLSLSIFDIKGLGEKTATALKGANINNIFELLLRIPKSFTAQEKSPGIAYMEEGHTYIAQVEIIRLKITGALFKKRLEAAVSDETGIMNLVFFGPAVNYAKNILEQNKTITLIGQVKMFLGRPQMVHPKLVNKNQEIKEDNTKDACYSQVAGFVPQNFKRIIKMAFSYIDNFPKEDHLTVEKLEELNLDNMYFALQKIHQYHEEKPKNKSLRRIAFEELLSYFYQILRERHLHTKNIGLYVPKNDIEILANNILPFSLTKAQTKAISEIIDDMTKEEAMSRLLQGDVGSGKTAVSALAAHSILKANSQVAIMAPTEILSEQLYLVYKKFFHNTDYKIALLTSSTKTKKRREIIEQINNNKINIIIGTHALLNDELKFHSLGLIIIDEQHRFGVNQRAALINEALKTQDFTPHLLVMTATPIPRSLALTLYGDLDLSVINERPPGRQKVETKILSGEVLNSLVKLCERIKDTDQKAFIVFPLVEESEHFDLENASNAYLLLKSTFGDNSCALLHGKMKAEEKNLAMEGFKNNNFRFLVSITVIEVGVDVPDATCMIIVHPERFGLAQLHQLRGRVGRGSLKSYCFLLTDIKNQFTTGYQRLKALSQTDDGFLLAKKDLELRGHGELLGTKQAGVTHFFVFNHEDFSDLITPAKRHAKSLHQMNPLPIEYSHLLSTKKVHFS